MLRTSPAALQAIRGCPDPGLPPEPESETLRAAVAAQLAVEQNAVRVGPGSAALLHAMIARQGPHGGGIVCSAGSWPPYRQNAADYLLNTRTIPLGDGYRHDLTAIALACSDRTRLVLLDSPHSAAGTTVPLDEVVDVAARLGPDTAVVLDNAYGDYQDDDLTAAISNAVNSRARILVTRTFSKAHQLFGLRVGYVVAHPDVMRTHGPLVGRYDVNRLGQVAAAASLTDPSTVAANRSIIRRRRIAVTDLLTAAGVTVAPSQGHVVLFTAAEAYKTAALLRQAQLSANVLTEPGLAGHLSLRIDDTGLDSLCAAFASVHHQL
ncbi:aminotransferase class I/II-fold pyridoxal phosphate-dependent enzyme [Actinoplanes derwentensis]|uniref:aminotransferase class I/II-fold pyridoxal phosphate-dependent enzyme n=1 Tax=Actinoplanes derwentensis TaxID=113562 RepID=UPI0012FDC48B|nr:aminotransferase class I/II-fold pyridoxal phosphate-dependent enzyme [Actinoplanes derwentensis]